jgi:hypothetical protein
MKRMLKQAQKWFLDDVFGKDRHATKVMYYYNTPWSAGDLDEIEARNCLAYPRYPDTKTFLFLYGWASGMDN